MSQFEITALALGVLLMLRSLIAPFARRTLLSITVVFVLCGMALGAGGVGVLEFKASDPFVAQLAIVTLVVVLFADGLRTDTEILRGSWHLPLRKLVLATPLTALIIAAAGHWLVHLSWPEALLLGALLAPTDPVLSGAVIHDRRVPRVIRSSLNLESGMNDGLALPAVVVLIAVLGGGDAHESWWLVFGREITFGVAVGAACGWAAARLIPRSEDAQPDDLSIYALGLALAAYGAALAVHGSGFIGVFVAALVLGALRRDISDCFSERAGDLVEIVKIGMLVVFGALLSGPALMSEGLAGVLVAVIALAAARPLAVLVALAGSGTPLATRLFYGWFGPRGIATVAFSLIVLSSGVPNADRLFHLAALTVYLSIILHGLTDTAGARWIARREHARPGEPQGRVTRRRARGG